ncbi:MAG: peptidyl-prolyl cis-trans isomerase [Henriciella sp.]|uniref:peptidylprolyl isomerase n=1 Tax=Henriciella sp. TaxID=1968823 RepID=UPI003C76CAEE
MTRLLREPLVHFIVLAGLIFAACGWFSQRAQKAEATITVTEADIERMSALYAIEAGNLPTSDDLRAMIADHVQQEALAREARKLGMAHGDTVIERRLAQKITFMLSGMDRLQPPADETLAAWYETNADRFTEPARWSFQHVYFSDPADPRLGPALASLNGDAATGWRQLGDPFMLQREYGSLPAREIVRQFGAAFLAKLETLEADPGAWQGPARSSFGAHLVRIIDKTEARLPPLEQVRPAVEAAWKEEMQRERTAEAIDEIVGKYDVVIAGARE